MGSGGQLRPSRAEVEWDFKNDCINDRVAVMVVPSQNCGCGGSGRCTSAQLAVICASSVLVDRLSFNNNRLTSFGTMREQPTIPSPLNKMSMMLPKLEVKDRSPSALLSKGLLT
eukprot:scaffold13354_cov181-Alexandrium_tamarense.AAC.12